MRKYVRLLRLKIRQHHFVIVKDLGKKKVRVCMNRLHSSVAEHSLRTQEVPGSNPIVGETIAKFQVFFFFN